MYSAAMSGSDYDKCTRLCSGCVCRTCRYFEGTVFRTIPGMVQVKQVYNTHQDCDIRTW